MSSRLICHVLLVLTLGVVASSPFSVVGATEKGDPCPKPGLAGTWKIVNDSHPDQEPGSVTISKGTGQNKRGYAYVLSDASGNVIESGMITVQSGGQGYIYTSANGDTAGVIIWDPKECRYEWAETSPTQDQGHLE